jgi:hypothetical protein
MFGRKSGIEGGAFNKIENQEAKEILAEIILHIRRHDEKGPKPEPTEEELAAGVDTEPLTPLSNTGKQNAAALGREDVDLRRAQVIGSPRIRSRHTAAFHMVGGRDEVSGEEEHDELEALIQELGDNQSRFRVDERLDFHDDKSAPLGKALDDAYYAKTYLTTIVNDSDRIARESGGEYESTFTAKAAQVAEMIQKYYEAASRLPAVSEAVQSAQAAKYGADIEQSTAPFERFMGTHQGLGESFLLRAVEKVEGVEKRDELLAAIGKEGFGFSEGFDIRIIQTADGTEAKLTYTNTRDGQKTEITLSKETLKELQNDADAMRNGE